MTKAQRTILRAAYTFVIARDRYAELDDEVGDTVRHPKARQVGRAMDALNRAEERLVRIVRDHPFMERVLAVIAVLACLLPVLAYAMDDRPATWEQKPRFGATRYYHAYEPGKLTRRTRSLTAAEVRRIETWCPTVCGCSYATTRSKRRGCPGGCTCRWVQDDTGEWRVSGQCGGYGSDYTGGGGHVCIGEGCTGGSSQILDVKLPNWLAARGERTCRCQVGYQACRLLLWEKQGRKDLYDVE